LFFFSSLKEKCQVELVLRMGERLNDFTIKSLSAGDGEVVSKISIHVLGEFGRGKRKEG